mmetsp:Transcript_20957/g.37733  ORF Transcript_20957/g.37733 Transcript_20957/m.37733 type:complete len:241 (-) Transcript_20957:523-1245(-)
MAEARVGQVMVGVHDNVVDNFLGFLNVLGFASKRHLVFLSRRRSLWCLRNAHLDAQLLLYGLDGGTLFTNEVWEAAWVDGDVLFFEVIEGHGGVSLLDELFDGALGYGHCVRWAHNGEDLTRRVDACNAALLLDELDRGALWANHNTNLRLWHLDGGRAQVALLRLFLLGLCLDCSPGSSTCCSCIFENRIHLCLVELRRSHSRNVLVSGAHAWYVLLILHGGRLALDLHGSLLPLLGLL